MMEDAETKRLREAFNRIDTDGTGTISIGELDDMAPKPTCQTWRAAFWGTA